MARSSLKAKPRDANQPSITSFFSKLKTPVKPKLNDTPIPVSVAAETQNDIPTPSSEARNDNNSATDPQSSPLKERRSEHRQSISPVSELTTVHLQSPPPTSPDASDEEPAVQVNKRRRVVDSDDEDEYKQTSSDASDSDASDGDFAPADTRSPVPAKKARSTSSSIAKYSSGTSYTASPAKPTHSPKPTPKRDFEKTNEERYSWLLDVRDADKNPVGHKDYDPRTLYIPPSAWSKFTPFEKQYWEIKSKMWNTVVFFKKGKFYELYENDAEIASSKFDLKLAGGGRANMRLCGVPEMSFDYWASSFIAQGYKVARVDQKESLLAKEMRDSKSGSKEDKIVKRELKCVLTGGTLVDSAMISDDLAIYCMAIKEILRPTSGPVIGLCIVDTATGMFQIAEFEDDMNYTRFETILAQVRPKELLLEKNGLSKAALHIIKNNTSTGVIYNYLKPITEFWTAQITEEELARAKYFESKDQDDRSNWPAAIKSVLNGKEAAMSAIGALLWYLRTLNIDEQLVSIGNFSAYDPLVKANNMVLDGQSLQNLEIFVNCFDGSETGTLFQFINRCTTSFGKRMLRNWLCRPLYSISHINARLDSIDQLIEDYTLQESVERLLVSLPDLERLLSRIHALSCKPKDFLRVIEGLEQIAVNMQKIKEHDLRGELRTVVDSMPNLDSDLEPWVDAFDRQKLLNEGIIIPREGFEPDFDASLGVIKEIEVRLRDQLREYRRMLKSQDLIFKDSGKEIYLIEVPVKLASSVPKDWLQMGATAKTKRFWSPEVRLLARELMEAREVHKIKEMGIQNKLYEMFATKYDTWISAVNVVAKIDCLLSISKASSGLGVPSCRPEFVDEERSVLEFNELRHPCICSNTEFIPNDIALGGSNAKLNLLTGANAAGKSTILRMTCIAVILAQMGCYVPAESCRMTPVDRIMTRLGANDNILAGQSTFYVELAETKKILADATDRTLLVIDELGRGGSSFDGFAIAESVLHHIATHIGSLGFFATHYGTLGTSFEDHPEVESKRMAILVNEDQRSVTFLYKLENGVSPGSFGMHVASMCGISHEIVDYAAEAAKTMEHTSKVLAKTSTEKVMPLGIFSDLRYFADAETCNSRSLITFFDQVSNVLSSRS
ncbi:hypothetical protein CANCADRAFT_75812 [Tortispora caseinolytica NRRL Y-17796]|uniref:DNA mismatch repair protein n=1 Tax=Tortispora caseinolytica NRRL Y-17796 TaxID=767744 RepID=A0A1E4TJ93_9ASCO|nr:hypothetical protein CANCADRAFT_75812 [Tortispora caseinolytica NRRL Y-17796]